MNHIPVSGSGAWEHVRVPFLCKEWYDGLGFTDYPRRKGYQDPSNYALELDQHSEAEQSAFLQTWLYFGMIEEVLGVHITMQDFVHEDLVDSTCLSEYTLAWYNRVLSMTHEQRHESHLRAQRCLTIVRSYCLTLLDEQIDGCPLTPEVRLSIKILGESLSQAKHSIWWSILGCNPIDYIDARGRWGSSSLLTQQLIERGWCPNEVAFLNNYPPGPTNAGAYYASYLERPYMGLHDKCTELRCALANPDMKTYQTKHSDAIKPACEGTCAEIQPSLKKIQAALAEGTIPLLYASPSNSGLDFEVVAYIAGMEYTAISHIWSDGLGNEKTNRIPSCQVCFLIQAINHALEKPQARKPHNQEDVLRTKATLFWIDTVCVPRADIDRDFRDMALDRMVSTYRKSKMVLVLDAELYRSHLPGTLEATVRVLCSKWMRRLWTLQEGILGAGKLQILFRDAVLDLWKGLDELVAEQTRAPWICHPLISFAIRTGIQQSARLRESGRTSWLFSDMKWRSTSRQADEAIVLANLFELDTSNLWQIPAEDRMKKVISLMETFPQRIIFAPGPRFEEEGFRWALKSFSDPSFFSLSYTAGTLQTSHCFQLGRPCLSLVLSYPGYILKAMSSPCFPSEFIIFDTELKRHMLVKKSQLLPERVSKIEPHVSKEVEVPASVMINESPVALILNRMLLEDTVHTYGAVVRLDQLDAGNRHYNILSGRHERAVEVLTSIMGTKSSQIFNSTTSFGIQRKIIQQTWSVR